MEKEFDGDELIKALGKAFAGTLEAAASADVMPPKPVRYKLSLKLRRRPDYKFIAQLERELNLDEDHLGKAINKAGLFACMDCLRGIQKCASLTRYDGISFNGKMREEGINQIIEQYRGKSPDSRVMWNVDGRNVSPSSATPHFLEDGTVSACHVR